MRFLALIGLMFISASVFAQNSFGNFDWKRDSRFEFQFIYNGRGTSMKGNLTENWPDKTDVTVVDQGFSLYIKVFQEGFAYAVVTSDNDDNGMVFLMELQNGFYVGMLKPAITGRKITILNDVKGVLEALNTVNGWNVATSMRSMREYFEANPAAQLTVFFDAIEAGQIKSIPKPRIDGGAVDNGVVQLPEETTRPPKIQVDQPDDGLVMPEEPVAPPTEQPVVGQPVVDQPIDLMGEQPSVDNGQGGFVPADMTQGWDGDEGGDPQWLIEERARQKKKRDQRHPVPPLDIPVDQDDDLG